MDFSHGDKTSDNVRKGIGTKKWLNEFNFATPKTRYRHLLRNSNDSENRNYGEISPGDFGRRRRSASTVPPDRTNIDPANEYVSRDFSGYSKDDIDSELSKYEDQVLFGNFLGGFAAERGLRPASHVGYPRSFSAVGFRHDRSRRIPKDRSTHNEYQYGVPGPSDKGYIDLTEKYPKLKQSEFYQQLYQKYPSAFRRRATPREIRHVSSRKVFNSGLKVRFEDDVTDDDRNSVQSDRPLTKWESEMAAYFNTGIDDQSRECLTSPTHSVCSTSSNLSVKERLHMNSQTLHQLLYEKSPFQSRKNDRDDLFSLPNHEHAAQGDRDFISKEQRKSLQSKICSQKDDLQSYRRKLNFCDPSKKSEPPPSASLEGTIWRVLSPDSPPDSAIDIDSVSVQSVVSVDRVQACFLNGPTRNSDISVGHGRHSAEFRDNFISEREIMSLQRQNDADVSEEADVYLSSAAALHRHGALHRDLHLHGANQRDSDVDSGIGQSNRSSHNDISGTQNGAALMTEQTSNSKSSWDSTGVPPKLRLPKQSLPLTPRGRPMKADHNLQSVLSPRYTVPDSEARELQGPVEMNPSWKEAAKGRVHFDDEIDDTDPSLGIPDVKVDEKQIAERYRQRRSPSPYHLIRRGDPAQNRPRSAPSFGRIQFRSAGSIGIPPSGKSDKAQTSASDIAVRDLSVKLGEDMISSSNLTTKNHSHSEMSSCQTEDPPVSHKVETVETPNQTDTKPKKSNTHKISSSSETQKALSPSELEELRSDLPSRTLLPNGSLDKQHEQVTKEILAQNATLSRSSSFSSLSSVSVSSLSDDNDFQTEMVLPKSKDLSNEKTVSGNSPNKNRTRKLRKLFRVKRGSYKPSLDEELLKRRNSLPNLTVSGVECLDLSGTNTLSKARSLENITQQNKIVSNPASSNSNPCNVITVKQYTNDKPSGGEISPVEDVDGQLSLERTSPSQESQSGRITPYESAVLNLDQNGVDVDELIDSDEKNVYQAKPVVIGNSKEAIKARTPRQHGENSPNREVSSSGERVRARIYKQRKSDNGKGNLSHINKYQGKRNLPVDAVVVEGNRLSPRKSSSDSSDEGRKYKSNIEFVEHKPPRSRSPHGSSNDKSHETRNRLDSGVDNPSKTSNRNSLVKGDNSIAHVLDKGSRLLPAVSDYASIEESANSDQIKPILSESVTVEDGDSQNNLYSQVNFNKKKPKGKSKPAWAENMSSSQPCIVSAVEEAIDSDVGPPLPDRKYQSTTNLERTKDLSGSRQSLFDKMGNFKKSAKSKFKSLRKAISLDRGVDKAGETTDQPIPPDGASGHAVSQTPKVKKAPSLKAFFKKKKSKYQPAEQLDKQQYLGSLPFKQSGTKPEKRLALEKCRTIESVDESEARRVGKLLQLNTDGTQLIELRKPANGPIGFYIARGNLQYSFGVFVSRFCDSLPEKLFFGLLGVGDEILEINNRPLHDLSLDKVYDTMAEKQTLYLKILPLMARRDV